jgi:glycosyltransferase involved in cell wall biosynthesis
MPDTRGTIEYEKSFMEGFMGEIEAFSKCGPLPLQPQIKIGVAITTKNRREVFNKTLLEWWGYEPIPNEYRLFVVDDGSDIPFTNENGYADYYYRFEQSVGIARAKNKCLEMMEAAGCTHMFLSDDDFYPTSPDWWKPYVMSGEAHLMYIFRDFSTRTKLHDTAVIYQDEKIVAYSHPRGVLLYLTRQVLDRVGGMDTAFGQWGWEHPEYSDRIYNAGLTTFKYMDVPGSDKLFHCLDEYVAVKSTVFGIDRQKQIMKNRPLYESRAGRADWMPYKDVIRFDEGYENIILTSYFTGVPDPQRGKWEPDEQQLSVLLDSCLPAKCNLLVLNDCFDDRIYKIDDATGHITYTRQRVVATINPYFQRWISYRKYLIDNKDRLRFVFCTDATDVEVLNNPFPHMKKGVLYTGDEPGTLQNTWLWNHHKHPTLRAFFKSSYQKMQLLNAGLLGGDIDIVIRFCGDMIDAYTKMVADEQLRGAPGPGLTDMGIFNFVARTGGFNVEHGRQVSTIFKAYEKTSTAWFRHK